jgi:hypothetical protein
MEEKWAGADWEAKFPADREVIPEYPLLFFWIPMLLLVVYGAGVIYSTVVDAHWTWRQDFPPLVLRGIAFFLATGLFFKSAQHQRRRRARRATIEEIILGMPEEKR